MNLLGKGTISAALFAATASVICAAPAQALSTLSFSGSGLTVTEASFGDTSATFNFTAPVGTSAGTGLFAGFDFIDFGSPLVVTDGVASLNPFLSDINSSDGLLKYSITSINQYKEEMVNGIKTYAFGILGDFYNDENSFVGSGAITANFSTTGSFSGTIADVPTPAAVLPILGGLLGMASKRKRNEEENA